MPSLVQQHDRLVARRQALYKLETRLAAWMQGWIILVALMFIIKVFVDGLPWWVVAVVASGQSVLFALTTLEYHVRWRTELARKKIEEKYQDQAAEDQ